MRIFQTHYSSGNQYAYTAQSALDHVHWYADMIAVCLQRFGNHAIHVDYDTFTKAPEAYRDGFEKLFSVQIPVEQAGGIPNDLAETQSYRRLFEALL